VHFQLLMFVQDSGSSEYFLLNMKAKRNVE
jgi:hypothetical protein